MKKGNFVIFILLGILVGMVSFLCFGEAKRLNLLDEKVNEESQEEAVVGRYQISETNGVNVIVLDTATGDLWTRSVNKTSGPTDWTQQNIEDIDQNTNETKTDKKIQVGRYKFTKTSGNNVIIIDTATGEMWTRYMMENSGTVNWSKELIFE